MHVHSSCLHLMNHTETAFVLFFSDLGHQTQYIQSLALCTMGAICSTEMSRDLAGEIEKMIKSSNAYIKKKVCISQHLIKLANIVPLCYGAGGSCSAQGVRRVYILGMLFVRVLSCCLLCLFFN